MENKKSKVDLVFILDRSGSMQGLEKETIAGFNRVLNEQRKREMDIAVTTILFDDQYEVLHPRINIQEVRPINGEQYFVRGSTALYDAIGKTIEELNRKQKHGGEEIDYSTMMVIITDGLENASHEYTLKKIQSLINKQQFEKDWEFLFLGSHLDSWKEAEDIGIQKDSFKAFEASEAGVRSSYKCVAEQLNQFLIAKKSNNKAK